ncbi:MAG: glycosyltransferase [Thermoleophilaceae bacterium]|nr:glycosyltransferase [Thermoleophilaceae bacterium]
MTGQSARGFILRRAARGASALTALSEAAAEKFEQMGLPRPRVIYPGIDLEVFRPRGERSEEPTLLCAAALDDARKQPALLIEGFRMARARKPLRLQLITARPTASPWRELAGEEGIEVLDGSGGTGVLAEAYSRAWVSVLTSYDEAFGLVLAEALACGTPGVGPRDAAVPEVLGEDGAGRMYELNDPESLATALLEAVEIADDPATREICRTRAQTFGRDAMVEQYVDVYEQLVS